MSLEEPITLPAIERTGQIEIDVFCPGCFYNLHGQVVTVDPRLNIPICKCPECGRFHPAGTGVSASSVWVRRFASFLLLMWVMAAIAITTALAGVMFGFAMSSIEAFRRFQSTPLAGNKWRFKIYLHPWQNPADPDRGIAGLSTMLGISFGSFVTGFVVGVLCVTVLWHWQRIRYLYAIIIPLIPAMILFMIYRSMIEYDQIITQCYARILCQSAVQCAGIFLGVLFGRKVSRTIIRMIIPPKPRQALAFLWTVDGKQLPVN